LVQGESATAALGNLNLSTSLARSQVPEPARPAGHGYVPFLTVRRREQRFRGGVADLGQMRFHTSHRCAAVHTRRIVLREYDSTVVAALSHLGMRKASLDAFKPRHPSLSAMGFRAALPIAERFFRHKHIYRSNSHFAAEQSQKLVARLARGETAYLAGISIR
jgi:hypothetical protein